jgi:hypothetical protein
VGLRPFVFVPRTLGRTWGTRPVSDSLMTGPTAKNIEVCGIPHLAKNERDVGHPGLGGRDRFRSSLEVVDLSVRWKG